MTAPLSAKLKALGVKVGTPGLQTSQTRPGRGEAARQTPSLEGVLPGRPLTTPLGETFVIEQVYPEDFHQGRVLLRNTAPLQVLAEWAGEPQVCACPPHSFAFLDTETTGLSGGAGTYAFLVGVGRFQADGFHLAQFFMRDPLEEPAQLAALETFLAPCETLVTFNGKAFDVPLLKTRYISNGWPPPFGGTAHVDLLHLARRLWSSRLPSRTLLNLETQILGSLRTEEDIPGWQIPELYFDYLRFGEVEPLKRVIYHNAMDIVSLAALFSHMAGLLADPLGGAVEHGVDLIALARLFESLNDLPSATRLYLHGLEHDLPKSTLLEAVDRLASIYKRQEDHAAAVQLWEQAARYGDLEAHLELAKHYEHRRRDHGEALRWTEAALALICTPRFSTGQREELQLELDHRKSRLQRKLTKR